jgi:hypothetical protein
VTTEMTLDELLTSDTEDEVLEFLLTELGFEDFPVTDYEPGGAGFTLLKIVARAIAEYQGVLREIAAGGLLDEAAKLTATGWLTLLAKSWFELDRIAAVFAKPKFRLTCAAGAGPFTITPGQLWVRVTATGKLFNSANTSNETLTSGGTLDLEFRAESPGADHNLALGAGLELATALPGVTVTTQETSTGSGTCMVVPGTDEESNAALLRRCRSRWATIGLQKTRDAYAFLATNVKLADGTSDPATVSVTKVLVDDTNPRGPNTVDVYLAGEAGGIPAGPIVTAVDTYLQERKALSADLLVAGATDASVSVAATVYCTAAQVAAAKTKLVELLTAYQAGLEIGDGAGAGTVYTTALIEILMTPAGVRNVVMTLPAANYVPALGDIAVLAYTIDTSITFVAI